MGNVVMKKTVFTVETISAGMGEVLVYVEDPAGHREEVRLLQLRPLSLWLTKIPLSSSSG